MNEPREILIIDDDPSFITAMKPVLESRGYQIAAAYNKQEAMEKIEKSRPDLILLDIMMERLTDGFEICCRLKQDPELKKIPVLAASAINKEVGLKFSPKTDGEYFPADGFLEKPVKPETLLEQVEELLNVWTDEDGNG